MKYIVFDCDGTLINPQKSTRPLYPGIFELITELKEQGHQLYVWTARDRISTLRILKSHDIFSLFEDICTIDDAKAKPDPEGLKRMLAGVSKDSICVIGDSSADIVGAQKFGVMSIAALWNQFSLSQDLEQFSPDFLVNDPKECSKVISDNLKGDGDV